MFRKLLDFVSLKAEVESNDYIYNQIEQGVEFRGTNFWILAFAIVVASVGLNTNSTAVIIGAMLISPLMGPINAIGYSVSTYNFPLFKRAFSNLGFAVITSLAASTIYFAITPVSTAHSELLARTNPTIYDVLIVFFGGLSGIVALASKRKGNVLPGVAIATALMPPLCTAGYGLGTGQYTFFFGALYLFIINAVFIAIANMIAIRYLKIPLTSRVEDSDRRRTKYIVYAVMILTILPSIYFGYRLVQDERFKEQAMNYCLAVKQIDDKFLLEQEIDVSGRRIKLIYGGDALTQEEKFHIVKEGLIYQIDTSKIYIHQGITLNKKLQIQDELSLEKNKNSQLDLLLNDSKRSIDSLLAVSNIGETLFKELHALHPEIIELSVGQGKSFGDSTANNNRHFITILRYSGKLSELNKQQINNWMQLRLKTSGAEILFVNQ